jgi:1,4-dihydroxy-2-naphthoyl-CoA hydrolase
MQRRESGVQICYTAGLMPDPEAPREALDPTRGWAGAMGLEFVKVTLEEVVVEWTTQEVHLQPHGIVHGGVFCGVVETVCSVGAALHAAPRGQIVVGVENHTSFIAATRAGRRLRCVGRPLQAGRRAHLWEANVFDEARLVATGRVRLLCLEAGTEPGAAKR